MARRVLKLLPASLFGSRGSYMETTGLLLKRHHSSHSASDITRSSMDPLFNYTSGRWLFNEPARLAERRLPFNKDALLIAIAKSKQRHVSDIASLHKFAQGGFNRILEATFTDGLRVLARMPYPMTAPKRYAVASEVATMDFLRQHGMPVPEVLAYCPSADNPVGAEYILLGKIEGRPLSDTWLSVENKTRLKILKQIASLEKQLFAIQLPGSGSIYYQEDLRDEDANRCLPIQQPSSAKPFVVGPITRLSWWEKQRASMPAERGPWRNFSDTFKAPAIREIKWCKQHGKPQLPDERGIREITRFEEASPHAHVALLKYYLELAPHLDIPSGDGLARPILRHPDLSPSNILVTDEHDIVGLIDWQHAVVLPLCIAGGIPQPFQNFGDPMSDLMQKPETELPPDFDQKTPKEQEEVREIRRKRFIHYMYAAYSLTINPENWMAIKEARVIVRARLYNRAAAPWEGNSLPLKSAIVRLLQQWPSILKETSDRGLIPGESPLLPTKYGENDMKELLELEDKMDDRLNELQMMQDSLGINSLGFCQNDEHWAWAKEMLETFRSGILAECNTDMERKQLTDHWPFEDHDEGH